MLDIAAVRIWVDFTNTAHVIVLRPLVERLEAAGHEVALTARPLSHTVELLEEWGRPHLVVGRHGGVHRRDKALAAGDRVRAAAAAGRARSASTARSPTARPTCRSSRALLRIPNSTMFDYEWAATQHHVNCRLANRVLVPEAIPPERLARYGARGAKLIRYPGLKEEYYLSDFEPDRGVLAAARRRGRRRCCASCAPRPSYALYLGGSETPLLARVLRRAAADARVHTVVLARTDEQRADVRALGLERVVVPERTVDGRSLVALADVLVSAGGTMNREAAVLGTPVWSMFEGPLGGVDEQLVREGRLKLLEDAGAIAFEPKPPGALARPRAPRSRPTCWSSRCPGLRLTALAATLLTPRSRSARPDLRRGLEAQDAPPRRASCACRRRPQRRRPPRGVRTRYFLSLDRAGRRRPARHGARPRRAGRSARHRRAARAAGLKPARGT